MLFFIPYPNTGSNNTDTNLILTTTTIHERKISWSRSNYPSLGTENIIYVPIRTYPLWLCYIYYTSDSCCFFVWIIIFHVCIARWIGSCAVLFNVRCARCMRCSYLFILVYRSQLRAYSLLISSYLLYITYKFIMRPTSQFASKSGALRMHQNDYT